MVLIFSCNSTDKKGRVMKRKIASLLSVIILFTFFLSGCAFLNSYGKLRQQPKGKNNVTVNKLEEYWSNYTIYYAGYYGSLSARHPSALMFDLKEDKKVLTGDKWTRVEDKQTLSILIDSIKDQESLNGINAQVWKILGPDDKFYGFLFSAWDHIVARVIDENTMFVYDLPLPPYLAQDGDDIMEFIPGQ